MKASIPWSRPLVCLAAAGAILTAAGCASASRQPAASAATAAPAARAAGGTPASASTLVDSANLTTEARQEGYKPEVHDGAVIYCWTDAETGSSIPTRKCVNQDQMREMLLQSQQVREDRRQSEASSTSCASPPC